MTMNRPTAADLAAARFHKSSHSGPGGNECVELAEVRSWAAVRDSKDPGRGILTFPSSSFAALVTMVKSADNI